MSHIYNMRNPKYDDYDDFLQVTVRRRSLWERLQAICWLLFCEWKQ